jgi:ketosteroid isomerase-like protein
MALPVTGREAKTMADRLEIERVLVGLYAARVGGDLEAVCASFTDDAIFQISGAGHANPIVTTAVGVQQFRPLLTIMVKTFKLSDQKTLSMLIDGSKAAVHWRANIFSRITGTTVLTELIDMVEIRDGRIASYIEFFVPR